MTLENPTTLQTAIQKALEKARSNAVQDVQDAVDALITSYGGTVPTDSDSATTTTTTTSSSSS